MFNVFCCSDLENLYMKDQAVPYAVLMGISFVVGVVRIVMTGMILVMSVAFAGELPEDFRKVGGAGATIVTTPNATDLHVLAAREIQRYVYLRTGTILPVKSRLPETGYAITIETDPTLEQQEYCLKTVVQADLVQLAITGGSDVAALWGAYHFAEKLGVRFYLHGDVIPDEKIELAFPDLNETHQPLFEMRGINPWATHTYGFEHWEVDGFKSVISQLAKMRMNFIGMHTYTECGWGSEPTVWIGMPEDVDQDGNPTFSYPSFYFNTERNLGGQAPQRTSEYGFGGSQFFETDIWGVSVMEGNMPFGKTIADRNEVFIRTGQLLREAFEYAHELSVKTALGSEIPLNHPSRLLPNAVRARLKEQGKSADDPEVHKALYRGTFIRAMKTYPLDYYWLWTPESWRRPRPDAVVNRSRDDLLLAVEAAKEVNAPFTLATAGWVLGPARDRTMFHNMLPKEMPFAALNGELGTVPVDKNFKSLGGRPGWAIPWMEDDLSMNSPQLWVGRIRRDAYDAHIYGCNGLIGLHWRTDEVGPMVGALAQAQWQMPSISGQEAEEEINVLGGSVAHFTAPQDNTELDPVYQSVRYDLRGYEFTVPNGKYSVTLQFNEPFFDLPGKRVFGVTIQGKTVIEELDILRRVGKNWALDLEFDDIQVEKGVLSIGFLKDISEQLMQDERKLLKSKYVSLPCIAGIVLDGPKKIKLNCGGPAWKDYLADPGTRNIPRYLPTEDFYHDWALHQFGPEASEKIAAFFTRMDGRLPTPAPGCPGIITVNHTPWNQVKGAYAFTDELASLGSKVVGQGNRARFDRWVKSFEYLRMIGKVGCDCGEMDLVMRVLGQKKETEERKAYVEEHVLPVRIRLNQDWGRMVTLAMETAESWGGIGHVIGHEVTNRKALRLLERYDPAMEQALGRPLPSEALPWEKYRGKPRIVVPTKRTHLHEGETLHLKVFVLSGKLPKSAALYWRPMGRGTYKKIDLRHVAQSVYNVTLPPTQHDGIEYYIQAQTDDEAELVWPNTAPEINHTIVINGKEQKG